MRSIYAALHQALHPNWMPDPQKWVWHTEDGQAQGFGLAWPDNIGEANLLWLVLGMPSPPDIYDARQSPMYMAILGLSSTAPGRRTVDAARLNSLTEFAAYMEQTQAGSPLCLMAESRLKYAR